MSNSSFMDLHTQMIKSVVHLLAKRIWPMETWGGGEASNTARKRSESVRSSFHHVSVNHVDVSADNLKSKRKVELLDNFFEVLNNMSHHIDNHIKDCKFFIDKLLKFFDS